MYGLAAIVIAILAAVVIRLIVRARSASDQGETVAAPDKAVGPAPIDQTLDDIPAIAAAVYAMIGTHRIVHIEDTRHGLTWTAEGRWQHQTSHQTAHHVAHPAAR